MRPIAHHRGSPSRPLGPPLSIVSRYIIAGSVKRRFLAEVKAKDEGAKEVAAATGDPPDEGPVGANIVRTHARCVPRSLRPPVAPAGLSRPRHSVRDTIRCKFVASPPNVVHPCRSRNSREQEPPSRKNR